MKTSKFGYYLLLIIVLQASTVSGQKTSMALTFSDAMKVTMSNSHTVKQSEYLLSEKKQQARGSMGLYMPKISLSASYMNMSDDLTLDLTPVRDAITPLYSTLAKYGTFTGVPNPDPNTNPYVPILPDSISTAVVRQKMNEALHQVEEGDWNPVLQKKQFATLDANAQWVLYAGGKVRSANKYMGLEYKEAQLEADRKNDEILCELAERYYGLALSRQVLLVRKDVLSGLDRHLSDAEKFYREGMINQADLLFAQYHRADAEKEMLNAQRNTEIVNRALLNTLVLSDSNEVLPVSPLFYNDSIESLDYFLDLARKNNPQLQQVDLKMQMARINRDVQRAAYLPEVAAQGSYNLANKDLSPYVPEWTVGIGLRWTIFDGASALYKMKGAGDKIKQVEEIRAEAGDDVETVVMKLYNELEMYREQIMQCDKTKSFAEEYVRVMEKSFNEQMSEESKLVDAKLALAKVNIEKLQLMYYYDVTLARLLQFCGNTGEFESYLLKNSKTDNYKPINEK